jgi:hypothetical protein
MVSPDGLKKGIDLVIILGLTVFVVMIIVALNYSGNGTVNKTLLQQGGFGTFNRTTTASGPALDFNSVNPATGNDLEIDVLSGATSWISPTNPLLVTVTGYAVGSYASNQIQATQGAVLSNTFTVTSTTTPIVLCTLCGNWVSINTITLSSQGLTALPGAAYPGIAITMDEDFANTLYLSHPAAGGTNTITANEIANVVLGNAYGAQLNYSSTGGAISNTYATNANLLIFAMLLIIVLLAVMMAIRGGVNQNSGGMM